MNVNVLMYAAMPSSALLKRKRARQSATAPAMNEQTCAAAPKTAVKRTRKPAAEGEVAKDAAAGDKPADAKE